MERGADINATDKDKNPLYIAVKEGRFEAAETLLKHGAESWWINFNEGKFTPEQVTELNSIKPEENLIVKNFTGMILDGLKRSDKNLSVDQFNMVKIQIENKLQKLLMKNPTQRNVGMAKMAKMLLERDYLPKMLVAVKQTKAASNSGFDMKSGTPVQKKHVEQTLKAETKLKGEVMVPVEEFINVMQIMCENELQAKRNIRMARNELQAKRNIGMARNELQAKRNIGMARNELQAKRNIGMARMLLVKDLADKIISNFKKNSFITLPEHVLDIIRVKVQDQLQEQLPENPSEHQKQAAQEGAQEFVKKIDLQEIMFAYFVSQTQPVKGGVETKEAGTEEPQSNFCSPEVVNADSKKRPVR